jgi:hypothetical protein
MRPVSGTRLDHECYASALPTSRRCLHMLPCALAFSSLLLAFCAISGVNGLACGLGWRRAATRGLGSGWPVSDYRYQHTIHIVGPHHIYLGEPNSARYTCIYARPLLVVGRSHYPKWKYLAKGLNSTNTTHRFLQQDCRLPYVANESSGRLRDAFIDMYQRLWFFRLH